MTQLMWFADLVWALPQPSIYSVMFYADLYANVYHLNDYRVDWICEDAYLNREAL